MPATSRARQKAALPAVGGVNLAADGGGQVERCTAPHEISFLCRSAVSWRVYRVRGRQEMPAQRETGLAGPALTRPYLSAKMPA
jgi:hypothetical protein